MSCGREWRITGLSTRVKGDLIRDTGWACAGCFRLKPKLVQKHVNECRACDRSSTETHGVHEPYKFNCAGFEQRRTAAVQTRQLI